jgi:hypothetical protein
MERGQKLKAIHLRTKEEIEVTVTTTFRKWIYLAELPGKFYCDDGMHNNSIYNPTHRLIV